MIAIYTKIPKNSPWIKPFLVKLFDWRIIERNFAFLRKACYFLTERFQMRLLIPLGETL